MNCDIKEQIKIFIREARRLESKSYYQFVQLNEICVSNLKKLENVPSDEQVEAYVLHLRKFIQNNDLVSIERIGKIVGKYLYENEIPTNDWNRLLNTYKQMIKSISLIDRYLINEEKLNCFDSISAKIYGDLAHINKDKMELYELICKNTSTHKLHDLEFYNFLSDTGEIIIDMAKFCSENIK